MFVVFEGIDGSGKTTISNRVADRLKAGGLSVTHLRSQGKFASVVTESIRELGRDSRNLHLVPQAELLLYVARDVQLIEEVLRPALRLNDVIVADRFLYTPQVLGHHGRHLSAAWMAPILTAAAGGVEPDLVVLVDVDPVVARARRKSAKLAAADDRPPARKGLAGVGLQHRLRRGYLELAAAAPDRWTVVENDDAPLDDIVARVTALVEEARQVGAPEALRRLRASSPGGGARSGGASGKPLGSPVEALHALLQWIDRRAEREPRVAAYVLSDLAGPGVDERRRALASRVPEAVLAGSIGLADVTSWELRESLKGAHPSAVALTLMGLPGDDERALSMRQSLEAQCPAEIAMSLSGLDTEGAWSARERLFDGHADAVVSSLARVGGARSWALRERWLDGKRSQLATHYETARAGARSVTACEEDAAWRVRDRARTIAPVAALASIEGLRDPRAWSWRQEHLFRAPKVVMATLRGVRDPEAWEMRRAVAVDCKEALDSVVALDDKEAWDLREAHADTWPSTVVKTLGPLAHTPRGQALVTRQLAKYSDNVSLLKHAAAIALSALVLAIGVVGAGCSSAGPGGGDGGPMPDGGLGTGRLLPWKTGNSWTYRVTSSSSSSTKVTTIGAEEPVGGDGPNSAVMANKVVTKKGDTGTDQSISWQADVGDKVIRYREQSFSASTGALELDEHWSPYKLHVDDSSAHLVLNASWLETYDETKLPTGVQPATSQQRDRWSVIAIGDKITVPAGTFYAVVFQKIGGNSSKTYWYVPGVGKVKESGGQLEELVSWQVAP